jgi:hypothetical protein
MCKTLNVEDNVTFHQMLKEIPCSRFPTIEIEEEPDGRYLFNKIDSFHPEIVIYKMEDNIRHFTTEGGSLWV